MSDYRCFWNEVGKTVCGKAATHGTLLRDGTYYLCKYHAGKARRDGWRGVRPLKGQAKEEAEATERVRAQLTKALFR